MFGINKNTGTVYSKAIIDRESDFATYGTFILGKINEKKKGREFISGTKRIHI